MHSIFQCLPTEIVKYIRFLALEAAPTAKLIKELYFANSSVVTNDYFCKLSHIKHFVFWDGRQFDTYKSIQCLRKTDRLELQQK